MSAQTVDFAVFGSTPLAVLLAGLLSSAHDRKVVLVGDVDWTYRLASAIDVSVAPFTRPETWALLRQVTPEAMRLFTRIAGKTRGAITRLDPVFVADGATAGMALSHMHHTALGYGHAVERLQPGGLVGEQGSGLRLRDCLALSRSRLAAPVERWLGETRVIRASAATSAVSLHADGRASIETASGPIEAHKAILADDEAILAHLRPDDWGPLQRGHASAILTAPTRTLPAPCLFHLDRQIVLRQAESGSAHILAGGQGDGMRMRVGHLLAGHGPVRLAGERRLDVVETEDGAPFVHAPADGPMVIANLRATGVFLAPALARFVAGSAGDLEAAYFGRHGSTARAHVAEYREASQ